MNKKSKVDVLLSSMTPAQVNNEYPMVFDKWQLQKQMVEGVKIGQRLTHDHHVIKKAHEKESWAGIPKMNLDSLDPNSAYRSYSMAGTLSPRQDKRGRSNVLTKHQKREAIRKEVIREMNADAKLNRKNKIRLAAEEEQRTQQKFLKFGDSIVNQYAVPERYDRFDNKKLTGDFDQFTSTMADVN